MKDSYLAIIALVERLHRQFLEVIKTELDSLGAFDINNVQALILFNVGDAELTMGELTLRGCYLGANVSYNMNKMLDSGYLVAERSARDRRSVRVWLSPKGLDLRAKLDDMHHRHIAKLSEIPLDEKTLEDTGTTLLRLDRFWTQTAERGVSILRRAS